MERYTGWYGKIILLSFRDDWVILANVSRPRDEVTFHFALFPLFSPSIILQRHPHRPPQRNFQFNNFTTIGKDSQT
jgi:hypothetical protein